MTSITSKNTNRYYFIYILSCFIIGCSLIITIFIRTDFQLRISLSVNPDDEIIDHEDEWKYQNSITGEWYHWRTGKKKDNNNTEWRVKWLNIPPTSSLGVIVYLTMRTKVYYLNKSLAQLSLLLANNPRPVVIFHEGDFNDNDIQQSLAQTLGSRTPLAFERIQFSNSSTRSGPIHRGYTFSYLNMCRFFTLMLPNHPLLTLFTFYWRLDSHSYILGSKPIEDPFEIMQKRHIQYAFAMVYLETEEYAIGLLSLFHEFLKNHNLKASTAFKKTQTTQSGQYSLAIISTNFAIANVSLFRDHSLMRAWLHKVDRNGGIYRHRWGDAPIHTLAVTQFLEPDQIVQLRYFGYMHRTEYVCPRGIERHFCEKQLRSILPNPNIIFINLIGGCLPAGSPLCHYYPEIEL